MLREAGDIHQVGGLPSFLHVCLLVKVSLLSSVGFFFFDCIKISLHKIIKIGKDLQDLEVQPLIAYHNALESRNFLIKSGVTVLPRLKNCTAFNTLKFVC